MFHRFTITDGTRVLIFSAFAYLLAYMFLLSYLNHFGINSLAITITIPNLIVSLAALGFALFVLDQLAELWRELEPALRGNGPVTQLLRENLRNLFALSIMVALLYGLTGEIAWLFYVVGLVYLVFPLLGALFYMLFKKKSFTQGLAQIYKNRDEQHPSQQKKLPSYTESLAVYIGAAILLIAIASLSGKVFAVYSTDFFIVGESKNIKELLIQKNDDELLVKRFNTSTHKFEGGFQFRHYEDSLSLNERYSIKKIENN